MTLEKALVGGFAALRMNENEWMNVFHSVMPPFSHSIIQTMITDSLIPALPDYVSGIH